MKYEIYEFEDVKIEKKENYLILNISDSQKISFEQKKLFNSILNFGYCPIEEGNFKISDKQIVDFWEYAKSSVLKNLNLKEYYALFGISAPFESKIPTLKETETFTSDSFKMVVVWINDISTGKMASSPAAYKRKGLELFNFEDENLGSIFSEYFNLYEIIDEANLSWRNWTKTERYDFLEKLSILSEKRKIIFSDSLAQAKEFIKSN